LHDLEQKGNTVSRRNWKRLALLATATLLVTASVVSPAAAKRAGDGPDYFVDESKLPFDALPGFEDATLLWGVIDGAGYRIEVPADWNGDLVIWAHGFRGSGLELTVDNHPLREFLIPNGYAWAASSYSRNDYDIEAGMVDTRRLVLDFKNLVGSHPDLTYLTGASMGGHITAASIEEWKGLYDGAMPFCGVVGDFENFDFYTDFNLAAQQIGLGSSSFPVDPAQYVAIDVPTIKSNLEALPGTWPALLNADGEAFRQLVELRSGGDRPNFDEAFFFWNKFPNFETGPGNFLFDLGLGDGTLPGRTGVVVDNADTVYQTDLDPSISAAEQDLNDGIARVAFDKQARKIRSSKNVRAVEGTFNIPVLSLHNLGDLFVPFLNEVEYARDAAARGNSDLLVQRAIRGVGHCDFTAFELITAFVDLVNWVESGVKPAGDTVLDPAIVADPDYGCTFTIDPLGEHILATPCGG
jgi:hypothetical protein